jgi:glycosyltransferase involved in cell wall biosynthesis
MKVLMTADPVGGVWTYALELAGALAPHGVEVALATMGAPLTVAQREEMGRLGNVELFESRYRLEWMEDPWEDVRRAGDWLLGLAERVRPDLVHLNGYAQGALPWGVPVLMVGHSCVLSWWRAVKGAEAPPAWASYRREVARGLAAADLVLSPSAAMLSALQEYYGPLRAAGVIPNGRDPSRFAVRAKEPLILSAGRIWDEAKNVAALAAVAPSLPWPVHVAGEAMHPDGSIAFRHAVRYLGRLSSEALAVWFGRAAIYALPARYEPFGLSALEAALSGCALVLGDIPSLREVWGDAALFVPPDDLPALRQSLEVLIHDARTRNELSERARERARAYAPERMAGRYHAAYAELVGRRRAGEVAACAS